MFQGNFFVLILNKVGCICIYSDILGRKIKMVDAGQTRDG
jgi:hypothetical protein